MSSDLGESPGYRSFLGCVHDFYRQAECELPYFESDEGSPVTFEASVGDVKFSVGYDPSAGEASLFVYCPFGPVPSDGEGPVLRRLLALNIGLAREHNATYCIDTNTDEAAYYLRCNPAQVDAGWLRQELVRVARQAEQWRDDHFLAGSQGLEAGSVQAPFAPWQALA